MKLFGYEIKKAEPTTNQLTIPEHVSGSVYFDSLGGLSYSMKSRTIRSDYENAFAPVSAIVDEVIKRNVHLASPNNPDNDITASQPIWGAFMRPNSAMGWIDFLGILISGFMALPELSILLWHTDGNKAVAGCPEGGFKLNNIFGFTVLPRGSRYDDGTGEEKWRITTRKYGIQTFGADSVVTLKYSMLPDDGRTGVSPGSSSSQEAAIRDALNQYERGFFTNGAKPSIIVTIHARTDKEYEAIQRSYETNYRGAGKQGGVLYQKVIDNPVAGSTQPSIEITPVGAVNDSLAINDIVSFTSQTINANYGVSPIIFGDASTTTYQNQQIVDRKFMARVQSVLVRLFSGLERELERVTKAPLPFRFAWDSTDIELTEELKVKAQTRVSNASALKQLIDMGADSDKAIEALGLGEEWLGLGLVSPTTMPAPTDPAANKAPEANATTGRRKRVAERQVELVNRVRDQLLDIAQHRLDYATGKVAAALMPSEMDYAEALLATLQELADAGGVTTARQLAQEIKDYKVGTSYEMSTEAFALIKSRANEVIVTYSNLLDSEIAKLRTDDPEGWTKAFEASVAAGVIGARIDAVTINETKNAFQAGQLDNAVNIQNQYREQYPDANARIIKTWHATGANPCEFCEKMEGVEAGIQDTFVPDGLIHAGEHTLVLDTDYSDGTLPDAHVNCQCTFGFHVEVDRD